MNEKTKRILSYVACTLGGVALGIALLGGLSYCSVSEKAEQTQVNTILTKKNRSSTNPTNGITSYTFDVTPVWGDLGEIYAVCYGVDTTTYDLSTPDSQLMAENGSYWQVSVPYIEQAIDLYQPTTQNNLRFLAVWGYTPWWGSGTSMYWAYFTFLVPTGGLTKAPKTFIMTTSWVNAKGIQLENPEYAWNANAKGMYLTFEKSNQILVDTRSTATTEPLESVTFQDMESYFKLQGWESGYESGNNVGYWAGYNDGVGTAGNFTNISGNVNALIDLAPLGVSTTGGYSHGLTDTKYYTLLSFRDQDEESWTVQIEDGVASDQPSGTRTAYLNLYSPNEGYKGWIGYAVRNSSTTTFSVQKINTFTFEFATVTNVLGRSLTDEYVLIWGWVSDNVSYQAGYNAGYADGFEGTNVNNVFSLFTGAFNAVGGIFNLKVFGFLPLYWFFLTPIFIAIIALLLRMIKH